MLENIFRRRSRQDARGVLLGTLWSFSKLGQEEVSLPEILDAASSIKELLPPSRSTGEFGFSAGVLAWIEDLVENGYVHRYEYTHDGLLPRSYVELTDLGRGRARAVVEELSPQKTALIERNVKAAIGHHRENWRLYARI